MFNISDCFTRICVWGQESFLVTIFFGYILKHAGLNYPHHFTLHTYYTDNKVEYEVTKGIKTEAFPVFTKTPVQYLHGNNPNELPTYRTNFLKSLSEKMYYNALLASFMTMLHINTREILSEKEVILVNVMISP